MVDALSSTLALNLAMEKWNTYGVLLLLDLKGLAVLECPLDDVSLGRGSLDKLALLKLRPELAEVLELDQVPDIAEGSVDDGRLADGGGGGNGRHDEVDNWLCRELGVV